MYGWNWDQLESHTCHVKKENSLRDNKVEFPGVCVCFLSCSLACLLNAFPCFFFSFLLSASLSSLNAIYRKKEKSAKVLISNGEVIRCMDEIGRAEGEG
jgi:amino acid permease